MPIGNPVTLTSNVASKTISATATASQTLFNVTGGYRINQLSVFRNGVRLVNGQDFTARDGLTVRLLNAANLNDTLQFQVFDTFRIAEAIGPNVDEQTIRGNLNVVGILSCTDLEGPVNLNITSGIQTFHDVRVGGALTVAGTITYEDVGNTNTTGIATFSGGMLITGVGATATTLNVTGVSTFAGAINGNLTGNATGLSGTPNIDCGTGSFTGDVDIADKIIHTGDTDTAIRFPATNTFTVETAGSERLRVTTSGTITTGINTAGAVRITDNLTPVAGQGLELFCPDTSSSTIQSFDRTNGQTDKLTLRGNPVELKDNSTIRLATGPAGTITTGISTADGFSVGDNEYITAGIGSDLAIFHDGSDNIIKSGAKLKIQAIGSNTFTVNISARTDKETIICYNNTNTPYVELYHNNVKKFETTSAGVTVTGTLNATTAITQNGNPLATNGKAIAMALIFG